MHVLLYGSYTGKRYREATSAEIERTLSAPRLDHRTCPPGHGGDVFIAPAAGDEGFWSAWHARHPQPSAPAASIASDAENLKPRDRRALSRTALVALRLPSLTVAAGPTCGAQVPPELSTDVLRRGSVIGADLGDPRRLQSRVPTAPVMRWFRGGPKAS